MRTFKLTIAYDGTEFVGWQRQAAGVSIQALLEDALAPIEGSAVTVIGAGRTDAGVHALGQVASVALTAAIGARELTRALNAVLPAAVRVIALDEAPDSFNARFDARGKAYRYRIVNDEVISPFERLYAWHVPKPLDTRAMHAAASTLRGTHDFAAFQSAGGSVATTTRTVAGSTVTSEQNTRGERLVVYDVSGDGFLRHMVRSIAGTLVEIGLGRMPASALPEILASRDRQRAGPTAPAHGLFLISVEY